MVRKLKQAKHNQYELVYVFLMILVALLTGILLMKVFCDLSPLSITSVWRG